MRVAGIDIPDNKRGEIALTYIFGIGKSSAQKILFNAGVNLSTKVSDWSEEESNKIRLSKWWRLFYFSTILWS